MNYVRYYSLDVYHKLTTSIFAMLCHVPMQYVGDLKALVLLWSWSLHANSQAIKTSDLVIYLHYLLYTKLYINTRNWLISQPIAIVVETDWATKRNTSVVNDRYV